jgi:hypothetical protein
MATCGSKDLSSDLLPQDAAFVAVSTTTIDRSDYPTEQMAEQNALL